MKCAGTVMGFNVDYQYIVFYLTMAGVSQDTTMVNLYALRFLRR